MITLLTILVISMTSTSFLTGKRAADSLYNNMQFREAYEVYCDLLDNHEVKKDSDKYLTILNDLCDVCDVLGRKTELMVYLQQMLDLSIATNNDYYHSLALMMIGKRLHYEGDRVKCYDYMEQAVKLMERTNRHNKDHLLHSQLNVLSTLYHKDQNYEKALETDRYNVKITFEGTKWGSYPQVQQFDQRTALAKLAKTLITLGYVEEADAVYEQWQNVDISGYNPRDYFIVDYLSIRGRYQEAADIYNDLIEQIKAHGDTLSDIMKDAKESLAVLYEKMGDLKHSVELYQQVLVISDTLTARQTRANAQELAVLYETQENERQLADRNRWLLLLGCAVAVMALILAALYINNRIIRRKNKLMRQIVNDFTNYKENHPDVVNTEETDEDKKLFLRIDSIVDKRLLFLNPDVNREMLCNMVGIDKNQIARIIKTHSGADNLTAYLNRKRMQYAVVLMRKNPNWKIQAIADACGTPSISTFNRVFKQVYGMSPSEYAKIDYSYSH